MMNRRDRYKYIINYFAARQPNATTELQFSSPFQLLVSTVLSAQCTDRRVNTIAPQLFAAYPDVWSMAAAGAENILPYIKSVSYPNSKARHLAAMSRRLVEVFNGEVPLAADALMSLPGVGRKTANVLLSVLKGEPVMAVDTHVFRVSHRLGLVSSFANTPEKVERVLERNIPKRSIPSAHHWLLLHGRYICRSKHPRCADCPFNIFCPSVVAEEK